jgi:hypothetical protein
MTRQIRRVVDQSRHLFAGGAVLSVALWTAVHADPQGREEHRRRRSTPTGEVQREAGNTPPGRVTEAPAAFDNQTNGYDPQGAPYETLDEHNVVALRSFNDNRFIFEEVEGAEDGLGPTYNAQSCRECHQNIVTGGASQVAEHRTGHLLDGAFFESQGGSLIQSRATHPDINELVSFEDDVRTFRISTNTSGPDSSKRLPTRRCWRFATGSQPRCAEPPSASPCWRRTTRSGWDASAGRTSTPASNRSPPTRI